MSRTLTAITFVVLAACASPALAGPSLDVAKAMVADFNRYWRVVRPGHLLMPVTALEHAGESYSYCIPRRLKRLATDGARFRIRSLEARRHHVRIELETADGIRLTVIACDNRRLRQSFANEVVPLIVRSLFDYGAAPAQPTLVGHRQSRLVHLGICNHLPANEQREVLSSLEDATARGYRPCGACFTTETVLPLDGFAQARAAALREAQEFETAFPPIEDRAVQARIQAAGERVLAAFPIDLAGFDYVFKVVRSPQAQAEAFPTGFVFITDKLLDLVEDELELEFVLAHEIAHVELTLPPVGDDGWDCDPTFVLTVARAARWQRQREAVADLVAVHYLNQTARDPDFLGKARNILAKLRFMFEAPPEEKSGDGTSTHPGYAERLALFDPTRFAVAARQEPIPASPFGDDAFAVTVLAKVEEEKRTVVYLLIKASDLVTEAWRIGGLSFARLIDGRGKYYELFAGDLCYRIDVGDNVVVRAEAGGTGVYPKLDLQSAPLRLEALPQN